MKITLTGSLGNISKPLAEQLIKEGHSVTVISSNKDKEKDIIALGARAAIGSVKNVDFLTNAFKESDAVYCMIPPNFAEMDQLAYYSAVANSYFVALKASGVKRIVLLSSYGAHLPEGTGFIVGSNRSEKIIDAITDANVTHLRPGYFYYNLLHFVDMIKYTGSIGSNFGGNDRLPMVSPKDIAIAAAAELVKIDSSNKVRYVVCDDRTCNEVASILGSAIGKPELQWKIFTNKQMQEALERNGMPTSIAAMMVELGAAIHTGQLREDYDKHQEIFGKVKIEEYAKDFVGFYNSLQTY